MSHQPALADVIPRSWLLLIHQLPPEPAYLRVKVWRQLQSLGAVSLKNSVYALPSRDETREDFQWLLRTIVAGGGEGPLVEAGVVGGFTHQELEAVVPTARDCAFQAVRGGEPPLAAALGKPPRGRTGPLPAA